MYTKKSTRILSIALSLCLAFSLLSISSFADDDSGLAESFNGASVTRASVYFISASATAAASSGGKVAITVTISSYRNCTSIGAKTIQIQESTDAGASWSSVCTYSSSTYTSMLGSGYSYDATPVTYSGTAGRMYRAFVTCYAADSSGSDTTTCYSTSVTAK